MKMSEIYVYNSLSEQKELFVPLTPGHVDIYVCGPTVYDYVHVGNMRPVIVFDTLRRFLMYRGYTVKFVSNYTDVDDKIIAKAISEQKDVAQISAKYIKIFEDNLQNVNALLPDNTPRATTFVVKMIAFINDLIQKGFAYEKDGDVYFRVTKVAEYGKLANITLDELLVGARIQENINKENPADFLLWKKSKDALRWDAPWSSGRPGWHTECVVMINEVFEKALIDIHGGGFDLKFPHHENEIAQARAHSDSQLANYWMHNGFVNLNNEKMAKSTGNIITAQQFIEQYGGEVLRLLLLNTHYRAPVNLTDEVIRNTVNELTKLKRALTNTALFLPLKQGEITSESNNIKLFNAALADDLNTPNALTVLYDVVRQINVAVRQKNVEETQHLIIDILLILDVLGLDFIVPIVSEKDRELYKQYEQARAQKDYEKSDKIREMLVEKGLI